MTFGQGDEVERLFLYRSSFLPLESICSLFRRRMQMVTGLSALDSNLADVPRGMDLLVSLRKLARMNCASAW